MNESNLVFKNVNTDDKVQQNKKAIKKKGTFVSKFAVRKFTIY
jgi:hypothetical protein